MNSANFVTPVKPDNAAAAALCGCFRALDNSNGKCVVCNELMCISCLDRCRSRTSNANTRLTCSTCALKSMFGENRHDGEHVITWCVCSDERQETGLCHIDPFYAWSGWLALYVRSG